MCQWHNQTKETEIVRTYPQNGRTKTHKNNSETRTPTGRRTRGRQKTWWTDCIAKGPITSTVRSKDNRKRKKDSSETYNEQKALARHRFDVNNWMQLKTTSHDLDQLKT